MLELGHAIPTDEISPSHKNTDWDFFIESLTHPWAELDAVYLETADSRIERAGKIRSPAICPGTYPPIRKYVYGRLAILSPQANPLNLRHEHPSIHRQAKQNLQMRPGNLSYQPAHRKQVWSSSTGENLLSETSEEIKRT